jgi:hypothetical protein
LDIRGIWGQNMKQNLIPFSSLLLVISLLAGAAHATGDENNTNESTLPGEININATLLAQLILTETPHILELLQVMKLLLVMEIYLKMEFYLRAQPILSHRRVL